MTSTGLTFLTARRGNLLVKVGEPTRTQGHLPAFRDMIESLSLLGITRIRSLRDGLHISYDARIVDVTDLQDMLTAAEAAVRHGQGTHLSRTHTLSVTFEGPGSSDLPVAGLLLDNTETCLIRRLCRTSHVVTTLAAPGAAPVLVVTASDAMSSGAQECRPRKSVLPGTLLLSDAGITIATHECYSNELQIGRVAQRGTTRQRPHVGDFVRFQPVSPQTPNEFVPQECMT